MDAAGTYRVEIRRLPEAYNPQSGPYEVRLETLRPATAAELRSDAEQKTLTELEERWERAAAQSDVDALSKLMADDFFYFPGSPGGSAKAEHLASIAEQKKRNADVVETHT